MQKRYPLFLSALGSGNNARWASLHAIAQHDQGGLDTNALNRKNAKPPRQYEPFRASRAGIEQKSRSVPVRFWLVGMAEHADVRLFALKKRSSALRQRPAFIQDMTNGDAEACQFDHRLGWKPTLFIIIVDVARDGGNWCDPFQLFDHGSIANITGVENIIDAFKMPSDHGIESAVGVDNHSDPNGATLIPGATTVWGPIEACTCFQSNVNGSGDFFGKAASSAFNRSARAALIGCVESHSIRP